MPDRPEHPPTQPMVGDPPPLPFDRGLRGSGRQFSARLGVPATIDPLEINYASADIADGLQSRHAGRGVRLAAWILLWLPAAIVAGLGTWFIWRPAPYALAVPPTLGEQLGDMLGRLLLTAIAWLMHGFWFVVLTRRRR